MSDPMTELARMAEEEGLYYVDEATWREAVALARLKRSPKAMAAVEMEVHDERRIRRIARNVILQKRWTREVALSVKAAREAGDPWWVIAMALGVSPKEAEERYATLPD